MASGNAGNGMASEHGIAKGMEGTGQPGGADDPPGLGPLTRWLRLPIDLSLWVAVAAGTLMMLNVTLDVAGRTLFSAPIAGTTELVSAYYMVAAAFLPWAWLALTDGHLKVDLFARMLPPWAAVAQDVFARMATMAYLAIFTWQAWLMARQQTRIGEVWEAAGFYIAVWPTRWLLPFAGGLMLLYMVLRLAEDALRAIRR